MMVSHLAFLLLVCLSRSHSLSFTVGFLEKLMLIHLQRHTRSPSPSVFYFVSISAVGQLTLKRPFDFDHASISAPLGTSIQFSLLPLHCSHPFSSSVKQWHQLPSTAWNAELHPRPLYPLHFSNLTSKQFTFLQNGCSWFQMLNGCCFPFCFMQLYWQLGLDGNLLNHLVDTYFQKSLLCQKGNVQGNQRLPIISSHTSAQEMSPNAQNCFSCFKKTISTENRCFWWLLRSVWPLVNAYPPSFSHRA